MSTIGPVLRGHRLTLRPFGEADITGQYLDWLNDPLVTRYSNQRFRRHTIESAADYLHAFTDSGNLFLSVRRTVGDEAVGTMTAYFARHHGTVDVGILIGERLAWGQGIGQEAWDAFTGWLLSEGGVRKLTAGCVACNRGMVRIMERSGMVQEATRRAHEIIDGEPQDVLYYARFAAG